MKLLKEHRKSLLEELEKATADLAISRHYMNSEKDADLKQWFEIGDWLASERIALIKKALADNEIDY